jgi:hypothetical protein
MQELYNKLIHFNSYTDKWYIFDRSEQSLYLTDNSKMKSLKEFDTIEDLLKNFKYKDNNSQKENE